MPFETVPIKLSAQEYETEMMIRYLVNTHKRPEFKLRAMSFDILKGFYKLGKAIEAKSGSKRITCRDI